MKLRIVPRRVEHLELNIPKAKLMNEFKKVIDGKEPKRGLTTFYDQRALDGFFDGDGFVLRLKFSYVNSFKPVVRVSFEESGEATKVFIIYEMEPVGKFLMWVSFLFFGLLQLFLIACCQGLLKSDLSFVAFPSVMIFALFLFSRVGFFMSASHIEEEIRKAAQRRHYKHRQTPGRCKK